MNVKSRLEIEIKVKLYMLLKSYYHIFHSNTNLFYSFTTFGYFTLVLNSVHPNHTYGILVNPCNCSVNVPLYNNTIYELIHLRIS